MRTPLQQLADQGQSPWIQHLTRSWIHDREHGLPRLLRRGIAGAVADPVALATALAHTSVYDEQIRTLSPLLDDTEEFHRQLVRADVRDACDLLRPVWERTSGVDGYVSMEVDPRIAYDREAQFDQATRFHQEVDRPNLYVKIPGTQPGLGAIEDSIAAGRSINVTLIFSLARYAAVAEAYLRGLERLVAAGGDPSTVNSVASFFVSRVDTEADRRLEEAGRGDLAGRLAVANAKLAYAHWGEAFSGDRWEFLQGKGARAQRCLWASTSTKNPAYRDVLYVEELIGPEVVNTMPLETVQAFQDHGEVRDTLAEGLDEARELLDQLAEAGVDYDDVVATLEDEGVQKFSDSFGDLLAGIQDKLSTVGAR